MWKLWWTCTDEYRATNFYELNCLLVVRLSQKWRKRSVGFCFLFWMTWNGYYLNFGWRSEFKKVDLVLFYIFKMLIWLDEELLQQPNCWRSNLKIFLCLNLQQPVICLAYSMGPTHLTLHITKNSLFAPLVTAPNIELLRNWFSQIWIYFVYEVRVHVSVQTENEGNLELPRNFSWQLREMGGVRKLSEETRPGRRKFPNRDETIWDAGCNA